MKTKTIEKYIVYKKGNWKINDLNHLLETSVLDVCCSLRHAKDALEDYSHASAKIAKVTCVIEEIE
jgi:hypothetical protein